MLIQRGRGTGPTKPRQPRTMTRSVQRCTRPPSQVTTPAPRVSRGGQMRRKASFFMTAVADRPTVPSPASALVCRNCGASYPLGAQHACFECFGPLEIGYDAAALARVTREQIEAGPHTIWRYAGLLPVGQSPATRVESNTGMTPLI